MYYNWHRLDRFSPKVPINGIGGDMNWYQLVLKQVLLKQVLLKQVLLKQAQNFNGIRPTPLNSFVQGERIKAWISPTGQIYQLGTMMHAAFARQVLGIDTNGSVSWVGVDGKLTDAYTEFFKLGWIRLGRDYTTSGTIVASGSAESLARQHDLLERLGEQTEQRIENEIS